MKKLLFLVALFYSYSSFGQSSPGLYTGQIPTAGMWNSYFAGKIDFTGVGPSGNVLTSNGSVWLTQAPAPSSNLGGGSANAIPYQTAPNVTTFLSQGTGLLQENASAPSWLNFGTSVLNPGTNTLESLIPIQNISGASHAFIVADFFQKTRRTNSGSAMTDTLPAAGALTANGIQFQITNADATATDTVTAGSGTTIGGSATFVIQPGRDVWWAYDLANTTWRVVANSSLSVLYGGTAPTASQLYGGNAVPGSTSSISIGTGLTLSGATLSSTIVTGNETANAFFSGPTTGSPAPPTFRGIVSADLPLATTGAVGGVQVGSGLVVSSGIISNPTISGNESANTVFAGPTTGSPAPPTFRGIVSADLPLATTGAVGGVQIGTGLSVSSGVITPTFGTATSQVVQGGVVAAAGPIGSSSAIPSVTYNAAGQITATSTNAVVAPAGTLTGTTLASNVVSSSLTSASGGSFGTAAFSNTGTSGTTLPFLNGTNTWSGVQTFNNNDISLLGSSTGSTVFSSANAGSSSFTLTFPAATDTVVTLAATQTLTNKSIAASEINSGVLTTTNGGTGQASAAAAFNALNPMTTTGDTIYESATSVASRLAIGSTGNVSAVVSGKPAWVNPNTLGPMTTTGDIIYESGTNVSSRLAIGSTGQILTVAGGIPSWAPATQLISGYIFGYTLSNDGSLPNTSLDIAAGFAADSANATMITGTAFTKTLSCSAFVAGTGNCGTISSACQTNSTAASVWCHVYVITVSGATDYYVDTSATAANAPAGTTAHRYIGSIFINGSNHIQPFTQDGQKFIWTTSFQDLAGGNASVETAITLTVPLGIVTFPIENMKYTATVLGNSQVFPATSTSPDCTMYIDVISQSTGIQCVTTSNTSSQVSYINSASTGNTTFNTTGYINPHVAPTW